MKDKIILIHSLLEAEGVELREISVKGIDKIVEGFRNDDRGKGTGLFLATPTEVVVSDHDKFALPITEDPWVMKYCHSTHMSKDYFLHWRPFFAEIAKLPNLRGAEVGVLEGFLSAQVLKHIKPLKYFLIDPYEVYHDGIGELDKFNQEGWEGIYNSVVKRFGVLDNVEVIRKSSLEAAKGLKDESLDFVYIDANHHHQAVFEDICAWYPKIKKGGLIGGHDFNEPTVISGIYRFLLEVFHIDNKTKQLNYEILSFLTSKGNDWWLKKPSIC